MTQHPVRLVLLVLAVLAGVVVARNIAADKGGSYDPEPVREGGVR